MASRENEEAGTAPQTAELPRDIRIDRLGLIKFVHKQIEDELKPKLKADMLAKGQNSVVGDYCVGTLYEFTPDTIEVGAFLRLCDAKNISRAQRLSALKVNKEAALEFCSKSELAKISVKDAPVTPLKVDLKKGVVIKMAQAIEALATASKGEKS